MTGRWSTWVVAPALAAPLVALTAWVAHGIVAPPKAREGIAAPARPRRPPSPLCHRMPTCRPTASKSASTGAPRHCEPTAAAGCCTGDSRRRRPTPKRSSSRRRRAPRPCSRAKRAPSARPDPVTRHSSRRSRRTSGAVRSTSASSSTRARRRRASSRNGRRRSIARWPREDHCEHAKADAALGLRAGAWDRTDRPTRRSMGHVRRTGRAVATRDRGPEESRDQTSRHPEVIGRPEAEVAFAERPEQEIATPRCSRQPGGRSTPHHSCRTRPPMPLCFSDPG